MKMLRHLALGFCLPVLLLISLTGCEDKASMLVKSWKLVDLKYTTEIPKGMQPTIDRSVNDLKDNFTLTYNADGTYNTKMKDQVLEGKWKMNWNSSKISCETDRGETKEYTIVNLTDDKFEFEAMEGKDKVIFVMEAAK